MWVTASVAMLPPAPGRTSTRNCWPSFSERNWATRRATMSYHFHSGMNRRGAPVVGPRNGGSPVDSVCDSLRPSDSGVGPDGQVQQRPGDAVATSAEAREKSYDATANPDGVTARKRDEAA